MNKRYVVAYIYLVAASLLHNTMKHHEDEITKKSV